MLGNPGSNPLELFWDVVDVLDQKLDLKLVVIEDALKKHTPKLNDNNQVNANVNVDMEPGENVGGGDGEKPEKGFVVKPETSWEEFIKVVEEVADESVRALSEEDVRLIFKTVSASPSYCSLFIHCSVDNIIADLG